MIERRSKARLDSMKNRAIHELTEVFRHCPEYERIWFSLLAQSFEKALVEATGIKCPHEIANEGARKFMKKLVIGGSLNERSNKR